MEHLSIRENPVSMRTMNKNWVFTILMPRPCLTDWLMNHNYKTGERRIPSPKAKKK